MSGVPPEDQYDPFAGTALQAPDDEAPDLPSAADDMGQLVSYLSELLTVEQQALRGLIAIANKLERLVIAAEKTATIPPPPTPLPAPTSVTPAPWQTGAPPVPQGAPPTPPPAAGPVDPTQVPGYGWVCPVHGQWKVVPPGVARSGPRAGQPYPAFIACPAQGCREKPPRQ